MEDAGIRVVSRVMPRPYYMIGMGIFLCISKKERKQ